MRKNNQLFVSAVVCAALFIQTAHGQTKPMVKYNAGNKFVKVYTTAKGTDMKISEGETLHFTNKPQPVETEVSVFVDPDKNSRP